MVDPDSLHGSGPVEYTPSQTVSAGRTEAEKLLRSLPGVEGVGEGRDALGNPAWIAYIRDSSVAGALPSSVAGRPIVTEVSGEISMLPAGFDQSR
jgi:hypothetical protein